MGECCETGAEYVVMVEDEPLPSMKWFPSASQALNGVQQHSAGRDCIYLRLFYTDDLLGWNSEESPRYLAWSCII
ncbi:hypothetical protein BDW71DRAFT_182946 [Aspergillus fruticulosus]